MFFIVRGLSAAWSFAFVYIYNEGARFELASKVLVGLLCASLVIGVVWTPKTQGKTLKQITHERYNRKQGGRKEE
jgi:inositol transporter-like SP family MFS transporter